MSSFTSHRSVLASALLIAALGVSACSSSGTGSSSAAPANGSATGSSSSSSAAASSNASAAAPVSNGAAQVKVTLTNTGGKDACVLDHTSAPAGPVTFTVQNKDSAAITEVELMQDQRILGEKENLAPGLPAVNFTATLQGGKYDIYCPGAATPTQTFTVTGTAASPKQGDAHALLEDGAKQYAGYVTTQLGELKSGVATLKQKIDAGDVEGAKKAYAQARPFYEHIESDVDGFIVEGGDPKNNADNLDYLIDMRESNLDPDVGWHGFHAVERDLFEGGKITDDTKKMAAELDTNVGKLVDLAKNIEYKPEDLANGAASLLEEVQTEKVKGEEEAFSHLDLIDLAANVEGAQQAFALLKPGLEKLDPELTKSISGQFTTVNSMLDGYRDSSKLGGFKEWDEKLRTADADKVSQTVQGLQDPLSRLAEKVATA